MKNLLTVLALVLAVAFTAPVFAADDASAPAAALDKSVSSDKSADAKPAKHKHAHKAAAKKHKKAKKTDDAAASTEEPATK